MVKLSQPFGVQTYENRNNRLDPAWRNRAWFAGSSVEYFLAMLLIENPHPDAIRRIVLKNALKLYAATNGRVIPTRGVTRNKMLKFAEQLSGQTFPRSMKGVNAAIKALEPTTPQGVN